MAAAMAQPLLGWVGRLCVRRLGVSGARLGFKSVGVPAVSVRPPSRPAAKGGRRRPPQQQQQREGSNKAAQ
jgi:hypothetical protein